MSGEESLFHNRDIYEIINQLQTNDLKTFAYYVSKESYDVEQLPHLILPAMFVLF